MSRSVGSPAVVYPCSDGQPMGESDLHIECMLYVLSALKWHFEKRGREGAYVSANSFLYYEQGNPRAVVAPDVFVVRGIPNHLRDSYLLWKEPKGPDFVLEVTSASTRRDDERRKRGVYAALGVEEHFLYDPRGEYLAPPLQGYRLRAGEYRPLPAVAVLPGGGMAVYSEVLGLELRDLPEERMLRLHDPQTARDLLTYRESEQAREQEAAARQATEEVLGRESAARRAAEEVLGRENAARQTAEARVAKLEARLRDVERAAAESESKDGDS